MAAHLIVALVGPRPVEENHTWERSFALRLAQRSGKLDIVNVWMVTDTITRIDLPVDTWADVQVERGRLRWLIGPKHLPR